MVHQCLGVPQWTYALEVKTTHRTRRTVGWAALIYEWKADRERCKRSLKVVASVSSRIKVGQLSTSQVAMLQPSACRVTRSHPESAFPSATT
ncbi:hypothetical protein M422DRAFT_33405 [Sphaerobolus stellatus SS14]|uniref:Uncharacterized protein n=1 Tax=Sphaerobolus stellatus (strain SS14) TaxID=990650 RepID=A0A0C9V9S9_SPHS4|nr:hypothetical protein M422DRAFT_33405 [Sphaerobolus stellatus SS14]